MIPSLLTSRDLDARPTGRHQEIQVVVHAVPLRHACMSTVSPIRATDDLALAIDGWRVADCPAGRRSQVNQPPMLRPHKGVVAAGNGNPRESDDLANIVRYMAFDKRASKRAEAKARAFLDIQNGRRPAWALAVPTTSPRDLIAFAELAFSFAPGNVSSSERLPRFHIAARGTPANVTVPAMVPALFMPNAQPLAVPLGMGSGAMSSIRQFWLDTAQDDGRYPPESLHCFWRPRRHRSRWRAAVGLAFHWRVTKGNPCTRRGA